MRSAVGWPTGRHEWRRDLPDQHTARRTFCASGRPGTCFGWLRKGLVGIDRY